MIEELVQRAFAARNAAHLAHWRTKSYAQHVALGDFYDGIVGAIDDIVENYQGVFDLIFVKDLPETKQKDIIKQLEDDLVWINKNRKEICKGLPALDNLLQSLESCYMKTIYKLNNLS